MLPEASFRSQLQFLVFSMLGIKSLMQVAACCTHVQQPYDPSCWGRAPRKRRDLYLVDFCFLISALLSSM
ncbi:hypothetical protein YC2023_067290 [Brassica napus]